jgi:hypothetical protein
MEEPCFQCGETGHTNLMRERFTQVHIGKVVPTCDVCWTLYGKVMNLSRLVRRLFDRETLEKVPGLVRPEDLELGASYVVRDADPSTTYRRNFTLLSLLGHGEGIERLYVVTALDLDLAQVVELAFDRDVRFETL